MKTNKILITLILLIVIILCFSTRIQAFGDLDFGDLDLGNIIDSGQKFVDQDTSGVINFENLKNGFDSIYRFVYILAIIVAVVYGFYIAARIIVSSSAAEKVDAKKMILEYIRNVVFIALIPALFGIAIKLFVK